ncbi:MAG: diphthine--ammonia ligase [archaeon]|nr:diphthine--ammonia ligase [archaeon]MCR4323845.1 diphthine--ammonia ligase [Nanoarchaeota archaeon]
MKLAVLFSGGKDSTYAAWLAKKEGHEISCLISIFSENQDSYMFHTPSISRVEVQARVMDIPLIIQKTKGKKEEELKDLEKAILKAKEDYGVDGVVTGAVASVYQVSRIQKLCKKLGLKCINPLWGKDQIELLKGLVKDNFEVIITGVAAYPLGKDFLGRKIDTKFINEVKILQEKYKINPAGEGGEFESFVLNCPLFSRGLKVESFEDSGEGNSWRRELEVK